MLQVPNHIAARLTALLQQSENAPADVQVTFSEAVEDKPQGATMRVDGVELPARLCKLPTIVESHKSLDGGATYYKTGQVGQMLVVESDEAALPTEVELPNGLAPPTANIRKRKWRKRPPRDEKALEQVQLELEALVRGGPPPPLKELIMEDVEEEINGSGEGGGGGGGGGGVGIFGGGGGGGGGPLMINLTPLQQQQQAAREMLQGGGGGEGQPMMTPIQQQAREMLLQGQRQREAAAQQVQQLAGGGGGPRQEDDGDHLEAELGREMEAEGSTAAPAQRRSVSPLNQPQMQPLMPIASQQPRAGKELETQQQQQAREMMAAHQRAQQAAEHQAQQLREQAVQQARRDRQRQVEAAVAKARQELIRINADHARFMGMNVNANPALAQKRDEKVKGILAERAQAESVIAQLLEKLPFGENGMP